MGSVMQTAEPEVRAGPIGLRTAARAPATAPASRCERSVAGGGRHFLGGVLRPGGVWLLLVLAIPGCRAEERHAEEEAAVAVPKALDANGSPWDTVEVLMDEYSISMPSTVPAGSNVVRFANAGFEEHNIYFRRKGEESAAWTLERRMNPGERRVATVELDPGSYTAICDFSGHDGRGMFVDFVVLAGPDGDVP